MSYATPDDLKALSLPAGALAGLSDGDLQAGLDSASAMADGFLAAQFTLPLIAPFPSDLKQAVCDLGAYLALKKRGFSPEASSNELIVKGYDDARAWLRQVSLNQVHPQVTDSSAATGAPADPLVLSNDPRGW